MDDLFLPTIQQVNAEIVEFRRNLHANPELSFQEHQTAAKVRARLSQEPNIQVLPPLMETDVVAVLNADKPGPCIALRADMDALPIEEETDVPYKSVNPGVMHACGHDGHVATLLGSALVLARMADRLPGKVKFVFQPAEEGGGGGGILCDRGVLKNPNVDAAVALHGWPFEAVGAIAIRSGWVMAASNPFRITVHGQGSHGAYPHRGIDTIVVCAHIITALQTIVSRTIDPQEPAVLTIGQIHAGTRENIIPPTATMDGTLRYTNPEVGKQLRDRLIRTVELTAQAHGATAEVKIENGYPPMYNDEAITALIEQTGRDVLGDTNVQTKLPTSLGVEDFSYFAQKVPSAMIRLGVRPRGSDSYPPLHNPRFNFNDDALPVGIRMFCEITKRFLGQAKT